MKIINDFQKKWYSQVMTTLTASFLQTTVESFRIFDKSYPNAIKNKSYYTLDETWRKRVGYKDKSDDPDFDSKCYFHYNVDMRAKPELVDNLMYQNFIINMQVIYDEFDSILEQFLDECEQKNILKKSDFIRPDGTHNSLLRILNYKPKQSCNTLAKAHTDRWALTITIYETHGWLQFLSEWKWKDIHYESWIWNIFPGDDWVKVSNDDSIGTSHQVIKRWDNLERSAIVLFVNQLDYSQ